MNVIINFPIYSLLVIKMMYGFGEDMEPRDDTLELMEEYVIEFMNNVTKRSLIRSQRSGFNTIQLRDLLKVIE